MQYWLAAEVHDIYQDLIVKGMVVLKSEFEPVWRRAVELAVVAELCHFFKSSLFKVVVASILQELD
jgi:hypothetical protein